MVDKEDCDSDFLASERRLGLEGTFGGSSGMDGVAGGNAAASCVGVREPVDDAVGGGSKIDNRCRAERVGDGGIRFGSSTWLR